MSSISILLALSAEVTVAFGAGADNQARERLVFEFVLIAFDVRREKKKREKKSPSCRLV
jgi:hypothetical protein